MNTRHFVLAAALALLVASLAALLGMQWRALRGIREAEPKARWSVLRELVLQLAREPGDYYRPRARSALIVRPELFSDRAALARHLATHRFDGVRDFFIIDMMAGETCVFDGANLVPRDPGPVLHRRPAMWVPPAEIDNVPTLIIDSVDPDNRMLYYEVRNKHGVLIGVTAVVIDSNWLLRFLADASTRGIARAVGSEHARDVVMAVRDDKGRPLWMSSQGLPQQVDVHSSLDYFFRDWTIGAQSRAQTPEQLADRSFRLAIAANLLVATIAIAAVVLTFRASLREARLAAMKEAFVSNVSHELRTPLASIVLFGRLLRLGENRLTETKRYGNFIEAEGERLSQMVEKILTFSRTMHEPPTREPVELCAFVRETARDLTPADFEVELDCDRGPLIARIDQGSLRQALRNLLENAARYSNGSRRIIVRVAPDADFAAISVRDFGYGIAPDDQERVFERFFRAADERVAQVRGTGLGLSIVKGVATAHGGSVALESKVGEGSTFTIRLPLETTCETS